MACTALFALFFSISVSAVWEFAEFGADRLFQADMQNDTVITAIRSYALGDSLGEKGMLDGIEAVTVNGIPLPFDGYLDIGLFDTMWDMILEALGALVTAVLLLLDREKHTAFISV